jgi:hypothetical protein
VLEAFGWKLVRMSSQLLALDCVFRERLGIQTIMVCLGDADHVEIPTINSAHLPKNRQFAGSFVLSANIIMAEEVKAFEGEQKEGSLKLKCGAENFIIRSTVYSVLQYIRRPTEKKPQGFDETKLDASGAKNEADFVQKVVQAVSDDLLNVVSQNKDNLPWWAREDFDLTNKRAHQNLVQGMKYPVDETFVIKLAQRALNAKMKPSGLLLNQVNNGMACIFTHIRNPQEKFEIDVESTQSERIFWFTWYKNFGWKTMETKIIEQARQSLDLEGKQDIVTEENKGKVKSRLKRLHESGAETKGLLFGNKNSVKILLSVIYNEKKDYYVVSIPGGKRRLGESTLEGARRKAKEEAGVDLTDIVPKETIKFKACKAKILCFELF